MHRISFLHQLYHNYQSDNSFNQQPQGLYQPINYIMDLGGKRMRPLLVLLGYDMFGDTIEKALPVAHAVELFHNFTLMHDDIMDQAPLRRGKVTVHERYGVNTAILSGDVMLIHACQYLLRLNDPVKVPAMVEVFNRVAIEVCEGQQYDMDFEQRQDVTIDEYLQMIELKTAALLGGALQLGAMAAGAPQSDVEHLIHFGRQIGVAFQLQDDILDAFGDPSKFGKKVGGDIIQNKKTFLLLKAQMLADTATRATLQQLLDNASMPEEQKVAEVVEIFKQLNIPELASAEKARFEKLAFDSLEAVEVAPDKKQALVDLTLQLMGREH